jgi:amino acid transporter
MGANDAAGTPMLRERSLEVRHAVITSLAVVTPTAAIFFLTIPAALNAGKAMPFAFLIAFIAVLLIVNAIYRFTQRVAHAGSFFAFVRAGLGSRAGFMAGWLFLAFYPLVQIFSLVIFGAFVSQILQQHGNHHVDWWVIMLIGLVFIWGLSVLGIKISIRTDLLFLLFEAAVLGGLGLTILIKGGDSGSWHPEVFNPSGVGGSGLALAAVFGIQCFTGFEAASYLGEEAREPRRTIPRGMIITTLIAGVIYVLFAYIATIGWGPSHMATYGQNPAPWDVLGQRYWNSGSTIILDVAAAIAALAGGMASQNGAARMLYALGRDNLLPRALSHTNRRFGTPDVALTLLLVVSIVVGLLLGLHYGPINAFSLLGLIVTFAALGVYFLAQVSCGIFFWRRNEFNPFWHGIVPAAAIGVIVYLFIKSEFPTPPHPLNLAIWVAIVWALIGLVIVVALSATAPERFRRMAGIIGEDEPDKLAVEEGGSTAVPGTTS